MAAKSKYTSLKAAIAGAAAGAVVLGAAYFAANTSTQPSDASASGAPTVSTSTGFVPAQDAAAAPSTNSNQRLTAPSTTNRPSVATAPRVRKSRGS